MKQLVFILSIVLCLGTTVLAQNTTRADELMKQAQTNLEQKEYIKARYLYLQAYGAFANQQDYARAVKCGIQTCKLYHRENYYKEAFDLCRAMDQLIANGEQKQSKAMPELHFLVGGERLQMYIALKRAAQAKEILDQLTEYAKASRSDSINEDLLYTQANYYYTFGMYTQGDACFKKLIVKYKQQKNYPKVNDCYKTLISIAQKANNASLVARTYDKYIIWTDSVKALTAQDELTVLKRKYNESQQIIQDKEKSISTRHYVIIGLCIVSAILVAVLIVGGIILLRFILLTRKQKKAISIANEHNELKTQFIRNISAQMGPTLDTLDGKQPGVQALHAFAEHIQVLSELESTLSETYEMHEINISTFCENVMDKIKGKARPDVTATVNAPKLSVKTNPEQLERILIHLLNNAAEHTPEGGKIWLDFKKRGAHTHQFVVTDTGPGIPSEMQDNLFKPFTEVKDLTHGDGLGLPICSLIATKMSGSLTLENSYTKGARFILELHV
ncbi:MAG: HAMP domain-containing histidine kinase [Bacteroides sp.]|jgi:signal transduction histidine kinase|nr:HAMP domain-containing histidine kinase [Bacteroides sp.]MCI1683556.1 HAMP domain-containing histidine kinase [Bacteroides sp.]